ncbi:terminase small subunit [Rhodovulum sp. BSW8]|uniref:terminase small subunit n=1 Tax=Rhodovulum sp. BSW8 TaxID=2259645 RepID=UPI000DE4C5D4|nr:terminase small subunit [Rhodovulum sp. BSW8]RBO54664.1 terminase small subunit [Rhodovulum sp. BSW8]
MAGGKAKAKGGRGSQGTSRKPQPNRDVFRDRYLVHGNATQAAIEAGYSERSAGSTGHRLLKDAEMQRQIEEARQKLAESSQIEAQEVIRRFWEIATADPNELTQHRRGACRCCYGIDNAYQWTTPRAYERAKVAKAQELAGRGKDVDTLFNALMDQPELDPRMPLDEGGYGYDIKRDPHPDCPECHGLGVDYVHLADTRELTGAARLLFDGVKETRQGIEVKTKDQMKALENVARHLGLFKDKTEVSASAELLALARALCAGSESLTPGMRFDPDDEGGAS